MMNFSMRGSVPCSGIETARARVPEAIWPEVRPCRADTLPLMPQPTRDEAWKLV